MIKKYTLPAFIIFSLLVISFVCWRGYHYPTFGIDDANIYLVYMKNLATGNGFVWAIGGERVEGFSSIIWTLAGSLFYYITPAYFTMLLFICSLLFSFLTIYKTTLFARKLNDTEGRVLTATDVIILFLLIAPRGYIEWNILSLMETAFWVYLLVSTTLLLCSYYLNRQKMNLFHFSALIVLINITRPESMAFNLLFTVILFVMLYADHGWKYSIRKMVIPVISHMVSLGFLILWRISYFGYPLPNTYYAKVSGNEKNNLIGGIGYLIKFFGNYPLSAFALTLLLFFTVAMLLRLKQSRGKTEFGNHEKVQAVLMTVIFFGVALPVTTGGDHFGFSRFYQPLLPLLYLSAVNTYIWRNYLGITIQSRKAAAAAVAIAVTITAFFSSKVTLISFFRNETLNFPEFVIAENGRNAARDLNETFASCKHFPSVGAAATGGFGYVYKGNTIDMFGLNNTIMAHGSSIKMGIRSHASFEKKGFWALKPDIMGTAFGGEVIKDTASFKLYENLKEFRITSSPSGLLYELYKGLFDDEDFRQTYFPALLKNIHQSHFIFAYYHKSFLQSLDKSVFTATLLERNSDKHRLTSKNP